MLESQGDGRRTGAAATDVRKCLNKKGGRCNIHGEGAKSLYVPRMVTTAGPRGVKTTKLVKKLTWRCDLTREADTS